MASRNALLKYLRVEARPLFKRHFSEEVRGSFLDTNEVRDRVINVVKNFQKVDPSKVFKNGSSSCFSCRQVKVICKIYAGFRFRRVPQPQSFQLPQSGKLIVYFLFPCNAIERAIRTGIDSRLTFETAIREKDTLVAEFVGSVRGQKCILGSSLSLAKVLYAANISDWCSAVAIPVGGRCRDVAVPTSSHEERGLTDYSSFGPPLLNQLNGSGIAVMVKKSNIVACLAQFVSALPPHSGSVLYCFGTFGQVVCHLSSNTKLSILGIHKMANL
ncbi:hypothetical protein H5410_020585 [Solanum commersonii]|uniref:Uncharacterized protein n=1 Tax=Solanum commersonii TaxID=4109 RepID=A0A9J5ZBP7_SOLCO|nr:hypothetical protein H5410_020585 [Solanum commersonii]